MSVNTVPPPVTPAAEPGAAPSTPPGAPISTPPTQHTRLPLRRPKSGRIIGGVCAGIAAHLNVPVVAVRAVLGLLSLTGVGVALYVFWWVTIPSGDPVAVAEQAKPAAATRLAPRLAAMNSSSTPFRLSEIAVGVGMLATTGLLIAWRLGWTAQRTWLVPAVLALAGLALAWSQVDEAQSTPADKRRGWRSWIRTAGGLVLVIAGVMLIVAQDTPGWAVLQAASAALAVLMGFALVLAPWWLRLVRELAEARAARVREAERADIAAHLHDSVLQTLAMIRARADDAATVARLARAQERELRQWLYAERAAAGTSLAAELRELVAAVEDGRIGKPSPNGASAEAHAIEVVVVRDCAPAEATTALLQATREALVNAVAHGKPPVTVYMEVTDQAVEVFVRDRGAGFDTATIPEDRLGVKESIIGRMQRRDGSAEVVSRPGWGTEVRLRLPL